MGATPLTLRCPRCKKYRVWEPGHFNYDERSHENLVPTGRSKAIAKTSAGIHNVTAVEVKHDGPTAPHLGDGYCGHVFWTTHPYMVGQVFPNATRHGNANAHYARKEGT